MRLCLRVKKSKATLQTSRKFWSMIDLDAPYSIVLLLLLYMRRKNQHFWLFDILLSDMPHHVMYYIVVSSLNMPTGFTWQVNDWANMKD